MELREVIKRVVQQFIVPFIGRIMYGVFVVVGAFFILNKAISIINTLGNDVVIFESAESQERLFIVCIYWSIMEQLFKFCKKLLKN